MGIYDEFVTHLPDQLIFVNMCQAWILKNRFSFSWKNILFIFFLKIILD